MRYPRRLALLLLAVTSNVSLLLACAVGVVWRASYTDPVRLTRAYSLGPARWAEGQHLLASFHGGLWSLLLETYPRDPIWPAAAPKPPPPNWQVTPQLSSDWEQRLQPDIIGPRRALGFHRNTLRTERNWRADDGVHPGPRDIVIVEEHRSLRVPYAAVFLAFMILPAARLLRVAVRRWRSRRDESSSRVPAVAGRWTLEFLVTASVLCFVITAWQWARSFGPTTVVAYAQQWTTERIAPATSSYVPISCYDGRSLEISRSGWEVARTGRDDGSPRRGFSGGYVLTLSADAPPLARLDDFAGQATRLAGFAIARVSLPPGTTPALSWPTPPPPPPPPPATGPGSVLLLPRRVPRLAPPPSPTPPIQGWAVRIPHWAMLLATAAMPAAWALARLRTDRATRRRLAGQCPLCGYDLRATPDQCPECGHAPAAAHAT